MLRGLWRRGSVLEGRVQARGGVRRPHALPSEVRGARGSGFSSAASSLAHGAWGDSPARHPSPSAASRVHPKSRPWVRQLAALAAQESLYAPFLDPRGHQRACTGKRRVSRGEARSAFNSGGDEAPFTSGVPHHTPPDLAVSAPLLSLTHTHSRPETGEGRRLRNGVMMIIRARQPTRHKGFIKLIKNYGKDINNVRF